MISQTEFTVQPDAEILDAEDLINRGVIKVECDVHRVDHFNVGPGAEPYDFHLVGVQLEPSRPEPVMDRNLAALYGGPMR